MLLQYSNVVAQIDEYKEKIERYEEKIRAMEERNIQQTSFMAGETLTQDEEAAA